MRFFMEVGSWSEFPWRLDPDPSYHGGWIQMRFYMEVGSWSEFPWRSDPDPSFHGGRISIRFCMEVGTWYGLTWRSDPDPGPKSTRIRHSGLANQFIPQRKMMAGVQCCGNWSLLWCPRLDIWCTGASLLPIDKGQTVHKTVIDGLERKEDKQNKTDRRTNRHTEKDTDKEWSRKQRRDKRKKESTKNIGKTKYYRQYLLS